MNFLIIPIAIAGLWYFSKRQNSKLADIINSWLVSILVWKIGNEVESTLETYGMFEETYIILNRLILLLINLDFNMANLKKYYTWHLSGLH